MAAEAVLVLDIAPPHPRYTQLTQMAADVARRTQGVLSIAINPGGKVLYPGQASLDAVRSGRAPLAFVNSAFLQSIDPDLGFLNLPFTITDELMARPGIAEGILALVRSYVEAHGLKVLALMRGADTIMIFRDRQVRAPEDMRGLKIRVAGPGVYQEIVRSLGAEPVIFPAIEMGAALARGAMDGIITSPGGWGKNAQDAPSGSLVPGLLFYTYFLIVPRRSAPRSSVGCSIRPPAARRCAACCRRPRERKCARSSSRTCARLHPMSRREALLKVQLAQQHLLALGYTYPTSERLSAMVQNVLAPQSGGYSVTSISAGLTSFPPMSPLVAPYLPATR